ncbi:hypothetical protein ABZ883_14945 [Streptomyces sp. NPDC046977]|uniref:hypothetical protein n=1 Tax=Streptomyces sp. NPDC046977 TaxID=3154703 RepID=UPI0033EF6675
MPYPAYAAGAELTGADLSLSDLIGRTVFSATRDTAQSIATNTNPVVGNAISWETVEADLFGAWAAGNPTRWTAPFAGWWTLMGATAINAVASSAGLARFNAWFINGSLAVAGSNRIAAAPSNATATTNARTRAYLLAAGDYVELIAGQDSSGAVNSSTGSLRPYIQVQFSGN